MIENPNPDTNYFADPSLDFKAQADKLERRRALAKSLIERSQTSNDGSGYHGGRVFIVGGGPLGQIAQAVGGNYLDRQNDQQQSSLNAQEQAATKELLTRLGTPGTKEQMGPTEDGSTMPQQPLNVQEESARRLGVLGEGMALPSMRNIIAQQVGQELDYPRAREIEQAKANTEAARLEAQDKRQAALFAQQGELLDKRLAGQKDLRAIPTQHITVSTGGAGPSFGGTATQIGIDPRTDQPVYRHSKSSQLFKYDENGQPVAHEGAIAPKPAAAKEPTESERSSAGYLGRMEATEKNLGNAQPFSLPVQTGLDRAPNATNFVMSPEQQVQRQQQEDWVRAKLRKESGAVIGDQEMAREISTYFPMAGDSPQVIKQKAQSRAQALEQMRSSAGRSKPTEAKPVAPKSDTLTAAEQQELDTLRAKHGRK